MKTVMIEEEMFSSAMTDLVELRDHLESAGLNGLRHLVVSIMNDLEFGCQLVHDTSRAGHEELFEVLNTDASNKDYCERIYG